MLATNGQPTIKEMKRLILALVAIAAMLTSCATNEVKTTIEGRFVGNRVDSVFLEQVSDMYDAVNRLSGVALASDSSFKFEFKMAKGSSPRFFRLTFDSTIRPITLVVKPGDNIYLDSAGDIFLNYEVQNSEESKLIEVFNKEYFASVDRLAHLSEQIAKREQGAQALSMQAYAAAKGAMQAQVRFVGSHQNTLAAFYAARQHVVEEYVPQLEGKGISLPHIQALKEGLEQSYPDSPFIALLERDITEAQALVDLADKVVETSYPDITLEDMYKKKHSLSSYDGKVVLLYFWSAELAICNNINAELKTLYEKYHDQGFEVFQVSADAERALWIEAVRAQQLPWPSLFAGDEGRVFTLYSVAQLPTAYIISRDGTLTNCPLASSELELEIKKRL
jgi:peroxiredoxin